MHSSHLALERAPKPPLYERKKFLIRHYIGSYPLLRRPLHSSDNALWRLNTISSFWVCWKMFCCGCWPMRSFVAFCSKGPPMSGHQCKILTFSGLKLRQGPAVTGRQAPDSCGSAGANQQEDSITGLHLSLTLFEPKRVRRTQS